MLAGVGLGIMYVVSPYKVKRWVGIASSYSDVFVDRLKGQPYTHGGYDGIDVSKHNGVIKWKEIAKNKRINFVYIRAHMVKDMWIDIIAEISDWLVNMG